METSGRVKDQDIRPGTAGLAESILTNLFRFAASIRRVNRDLELLAKLLQLLDGRRPRNVRRHEVWISTALAEMESEFGGGGGLARALQTHEHQNERRPA